MCEHWRFSAFTAWHGTARQHSTFLAVVGATLGLGSPFLPRLLGSPESWSYSFGGFFTLISVDISLFSAGSAFFFFFLIQIEGLWQPCVEHAYQCHVPHSIMFKLRSVHLKEKLMLLYI